MYEERKEKEEEQLEKTMMSGVLGHRNVGNVVQEIGRQVECEIQRRNSCVNCECASCVSCVSCECQLSQL